MSSATRRLFGTGSIYTLATAAPMLTGIVITPLLTRALGLLEYDDVSFAIVIMNFTVGVLALGLPVAITRHAITEKTGEPGSRGIAVAGALIAIVIAVVVATVLYLSGHGVGIALAVLAGGLGGGVAMTQAYSLARQDSWFYVALALGVSFLAPAIALVAVFSVSPTSTTYYFALTIVYLVVCVAGFVRLLRQGPVIFSASDIRDALRLGLPVIPHQVAVGSATGAAVVVAQLQLPEGSSAQTQLALLVASAPLIIVSALSYAWTPIILRAPETEQGPQLQETAGGVAWLAAFGGGALALLAPWGLAILAPAREFGVAEMVPTVAIASLAACFAAAYLAHAQLVIAKGATAPLAILSPLALLLGAGIGFLLTPVLGLTAMGVEFALTFLLLLVFTRFLARRVSAVRWREARLVPPIAVGLAVAIGAAFLPWEDLFSIIVRLAAALVLLALAILRFLRAFRKPRVGAVSAPDMNAGEN